MKIYVRIVANKKKLNNTILYFVVWYFLFIFVEVINQY